MKIPEFRTVFRRWRQAFKERETDKRPIRFFHWEGELAYKDLARNELLEVVTLQKNMELDPAERRDWRIKRMVLPQLKRAVQIYVSRLDEVSSMNQRRKKDVQRLKRMHRWLLDQEKGCAEDSKLRTALQKCANLARYELTRIEQQHISAWLPPGVWRGLFSQAKAREPIRNIDLDGWFQITVAMIFRFFLREEDGVSLQTIGRLVVLFYICCGFTRYEYNPPGKQPVALKTLYTGDLLTVDAVVQKLRAARIQDLDLQVESSQSHGEVWINETADKMTVRSRPTRRSS